VAGGFERDGEVEIEIGEAEARALGSDFAMSFDEGAEADAVHKLYVIEIGDRAGGTRM
jgi:hypothetical protein